jgi:hypothetical protein
MAGVPLRNRVTPTGEIVRDPHRGLMMGNRGCLHGLGRDLGVSRWRSKLWICCVLEWKGVRRDPMPPGRWTALFFLDEATALAAGHRPCAYCRRGDYDAFTEAWRAAADLARRPKAADLARRPKAVEMDAVLHGERVTRDRRKITYRASVSELPDGVMIRADEVVGLLVAGRSRPWSFAGYGPAVEVAGEVEVLTPPSIVAAIRSGYRPLVHPTIAQPTTGIRASDRM